MANNDDDFFAFAVGSAAPPRPSPEPAADAGAAPPAEPPARAQSPASLKPASPDLFDLAPALKAEPTADFSVHEDAERPESAPSRPVPVRLVAAVGIGVFVVALGLFLAGGEEGAATAGGKRVDAAPRSNAQLVATPGGNVQVPGRGRITAAQEVVLDLDASAALRRVVCTVQAGELVVLTNIEQGTEGPRVRISTGATGCAGWLHAAVLAPE